MKYDRKKTFIIGFGFFSISLMWAIYNAFIPLFLKDFIKSNQTIGWVMTIDNILAVILLPIIGVLSDKTHTRFGRRMPYVIIGIPLAAVFFFLVPFYMSLPMLMITLILTNISMSVYRSPVIALMPDLTPPEARSKANGIINVMGGIGAVLAYGIGSILYGMNKTLPFAFVSMMMIIALVMLVVFIREPKNHYEKIENDYEGLKTVTWQDLKNTLLLLLAIFFWFVAYQGIEALFTLYGIDYLELAPRDAAFSLTFFSLSFLIFALPAGLIGEKVGKKKTIVAGLIGLIATFTILIYIKELILLRILLLIGGVFWACININSYPMVVGMTTSQKIGTYTGLYYLFSSAAAIVSPPLLGYMTDAFGYGIFFVYSTVAFIVALICLLAVEPKPQNQ